VKEHLLGKQFESEDDINTAVMVSLHHLCNDEYRTAIDGSGTSVVLISCILLLQENHTHNF
jgi:hypothetical protein